MPDLVALYVDALDSSHIDPEVTPNLYQWRENGSIANLSTLFAFKGISAAMYGGVPPSQSGVWMDFKVETTPNQKLGDSLLSIASKLPNGLPRKGLVTAYERVIRNTRVTPHIVPGELRPYFRAHPEKPISTEHALGNIPTIFDLFRQQDVSFRRVGLAGGPQERIKKKMPDVGEHSEDVVLFKITLLDHIGHKYGPGSEEHQEALSEVDKLLGTVAEKAIEDRGFELLLFSDHGMQTVDESIDLRSIFRNDIGLIEQEDFVAFFNSTCLLVRWLSPNARSQAISKLESEEKVSVLSDQDLERLDIGETSRDFADDVIATEPGIAISPDFYRHSPPAGMHGFTDNPLGGPVAITPHHPLTETGKLWDLPPTMMDLLPLEIPEKWTGKSLLQ